MLVGLINSPLLGIASVITLKYFEAGHSYMSSDSVHAKVEDQVITTLGISNDFLVDTCAMASYLIT